jgi:hypothetical protein
VERLPKYDDQKAGMVVTMRNHARNSSMVARRGCRGVPPWWDTTTSSHQYHPVFLINSKQTIEKNEWKIVT